MQKLLVIYGVGDFAMLMKYYFSNLRDCQVVGFCVDDEYIAAESVDGLPIIPFRKIQDHFPPERFQMFVAIGYKNMPARKCMFQKAINKGYQLVNYISEQAFIDSSVKIGTNNAIFAGTVIEPFATIGDNNIIWSSVNICHNARIASHCFLAAKSLVGGFSIIGENVFLGFSSIILQNLTLASNCLVGAGTTMLVNTEPFTKYWGNPGKVKGVLNSGDYKI